MPFWLLSFAGLVLSTIAVALTDAWARGAHFSSPVIHTGLLLTAHLSGFGILWIAQFILLMSGLIWLILRGTEQMGYNWQWYRVPPYLFELQDGQIAWGRTLRFHEQRFALAEARAHVERLERLGGAVEIEPNRWRAA